MATQPPLPDNQGRLPNPWNEASERLAYAIEAVQLTQRFMDRFWHANISIFKAPEVSAEAVPSDPILDCGYKLWPSLYALHALAEREWHWRFARGVGFYDPQIDSVFNGLERYYDAPAHAYNAWVTYPGNNDKYYDDNSLAIVVLVDCYNATLDMKYLERAWQIMADFVFGGWDSSGNPGGVTWGTDPSKPHTSDKTVSATAFAALAAFRLAQYYPDRPWFDRSFMVQWGYNALDWVWTKVRDPNDNLVRDGFRLVNGVWTIAGVMDTKWSYNTGIPIRAFVEHYRLVEKKDPNMAQQSLSRARALADAAINRNIKPLFDGLVTDPNRNFWHDNTFFVQHLITDGLMELYRVTRDGRYWDEIRRQANYQFWYIRDNDGMYFRNMRLWKIDKERYGLWTHLTGQTDSRLDKDSERDPDERSASDPSRTVKTLLANASVARMYWKIALPESWY